MAKLPKEQAEKEHPENGSEAAADSAESRAKAKTEKCRHEWIVDRKEKNFPSYPGKVFVYQRCVRCGEIQLNIEAAESD
jgi:hypothetical protein